jgi:uncharacterized protein YjbJ (UPF0337 family)
MNKDQVKGRAEEVKGNIKEGVGKAVGNDRLRGEGVADQVAGKTQAGYGDAKEKAKDVIDRTVGRADERSDDDKV